MRSISTRVPSWRRTSRRPGWGSGPQPEARLARMKDGTTHLAYKPEHAVDLDTGAIVAAEIHASDEGDTTTLPGPLRVAEANLDEVGRADAGRTSRVRHRQRVPFARRA